MDTIEHSNRLNVQRGRDTLSTVKLAPSKLALLVLSKLEVPHVWLKCVRSKSVHELLLDSCLAIDDFHRSSQYTQDRMYRGSRTTLQAILP